MQTLLRYVALIACFCLMAGAATLPATVADTIRLAVNGQTAVGSMTITTPGFTLPDGTYIAPGTSPVALKNGSFSVSLFPTDQAIPTAGGTLPVYYSVVYHLLSGGAVSERWSVPTTAGSLKIQNVLVAIPPELRLPSGDALPASCNSGDLFYLNGTLNMCSPGNSWLLMQGAADADAKFMAIPPGQGIPFFVGTKETRQATADDLVGLLGYTPPDPANAGSEYHATASAFRQQIGLGSAAVDDEAKFLLFSMLGAPNGSAQLNNDGKVLPVELPQLRDMSGLLNISQLNIQGVPSSEKFLNSQNGWVALDYSQITNQPTIPTNNNQLANGSGYAKSADLSAVALSGRYSDLLATPVLSDIVNHPASDFLLANLVNTSNGIAGLDVNSKVPLSFLPVIPATQTSGFGTAALQNANDFLAATLAGAANGVATLDGAQKLTLAQLPPVDYSLLTNAPIIPTRISQLTNDTGIPTLAALSSVAISGNYNDLINKPALLFDPEGTAASLTAGLMKGSNNLSELSDVVAARTKLGLATVAATGSFTDLLNQPVISQVGHSGLYTDLLARPVIPDAYVLPIASNLILGGVKIGANVTLSVDGTLSVAAPYVLPVATISAPGGVIVGQHLAVTPNGTISVNDADFDLAGAATAAAAGTMKAANNLSDLASLPAAQTNLGLKPVALSGSYNDLLNLPVIPAAYTLPFASATVLGGVKVGAGLTVETDGTLSAPFTYTLPLATTSTAGGVIVGSHLLISAPGVLSVNSADFEPVGAAAAAAAGKLAAANNLSDLASLATAQTNLGLKPVALSGSYNDLLNQPVIPAAYVLPIASATVRGGVICGANLTCATDGTISASADYVLPTASNSVTGGVKVGSGLLINPTSAVLSVDSSQFDPAGAATAASVGQLLASNNLSDLPSVTTAKANLGLAIEATTGSYNDLLDKPVIPAAYVLPVGSATTLGGVQCGANVTCTAGVLSAAPPYVLPSATTSALGGIVIGSGLLVNTSTNVVSVDGSLYDAAGAATTAAAGALQKSNNLSDLASVTTAKANLGLSVEATTGSYNDLLNKPVIPDAYVLPVASATVLGGVKVGANLTVALDGTLSGPTPYVLPLATTSTAGGIVVGSGLLVNTGTGVLSVNGSLYDAAGAATTANASALQKTNNLSDLASPTVAKTNLGLSALATTAAWADLSGKPSFGDIITHNAAEFVAVTRLGANLGVATLDVAGLLPLSELPQLNAGLITGLGTIATHNANEFILASAINANSGVAPLDANRLLPLANLPPIAYSTLTGRPTLATVATSGLYSDLTGAPVGLPPIGAAAGDLSGNYPAPRVIALNGQNLAALGAGVLANDSAGVPHLATTAQVQAAFGYTPLNPANNLSELASAATARTNLGLGSMALANVNGFLPDSGANGVVWRTATTVGSVTTITTRATTSGDLVALLGFTPLSTNTLGAANGIATLDANSQLTASQIPPIPFANITGTPSYVLSSAIGVTVAPLVSGLVPSAFLPPAALATTSTPGVVIVGSNLLVSAGGVLSVNSAAFDAAGAAAGATSGSLQKAANLSDLANPAASRTNLGLVPIAASGSYADLVNKPTFAAVATTGQYGDLLNKPTIFTALSDFTNDVGFLTTATLPVATSSSLGMVTPQSPYLSVSAGALTVNVGGVAGTVAVGNDPRIVGAVQTSSLGSNSGAAVLDANGKLLLTETPQNIPSGYVAGLGTAALQANAFFVQATQMNAANGVATLDGSVHVPLAELPQNIPYSYITGGPTAYVLPAATSSAIGGVMPGTGLVVNGSGVLSANFGTVVGSIAQGNDARLVNALQSTATYVNPSWLASISTSILSGSLPLASLPTNIPAANIAGGNVSDTAFSYIGGLTSDAQSQLNQISSQLTTLLNPAGTTPNANLSGFTNLLKNASSQVVNVVLFGDSITRCYQANCQLGPNSKSSLWAEQLRSYLQSHYGNHGTGIIPIVDGIGHIDTPNWTLANQDCSISGLVPGCWTVPTSDLIGPSQNGSQQTGGYVGFIGGGSVTMAPQTGDSVTIYYATAPETAAGFQVTIDGVNKGTFGAVAGPSGTAAAKTSISTGAGQHTMNITANGTSCCIYIYGAEWTLGNTGVSVHNIAVGGIRAEGWGTNPSKQMAWSDIIAGGHGLSIISLGTNDANTGISVSTYTNYMQQIVNHERSLGATDIMILNEPYMGYGTSPPQTQFWTAASNLGSLNDVMSMSDISAWASYGAANGNGYVTSDQVHLTDAGEVAMGSAVIDHIFGTTAGGSGTGGGTGGTTFSGGAVNSLSITETVAPALRVTGTTGIDSGNATMEVRTADSSVWMGIVAFQGAGFGFQDIAHSNTTWEAYFPTGAGVVLYDASTGGVNVQGTSSTFAGNGFFDIKSQDANADLQLIAFQGGGYTIFDNKASARLIDFNATAGTVLYDTTTLGVNVRGILSIFGGNGFLDVKSQDGLTDLQLLAAQGGGSTIFDNKNGARLIDFNSTAGTTLYDSNAFGVNVLGKVSIAGGNGFFDVKSADGLADLQMLAWQGGGYTIYDNKASIRLVDFNSGSGTLLYDATASGVNVIGKTGVQSGNGFFDVKAQDGLADLQLLAWQSGGGYTIYDNKNSLRLIDFNSTVGTTLYDTNTLGVNVVGKSGVASGNGFFDVKSQDTLSDLQILTYQGGGGIDLNNRTGGINHISMSFTADGLIKLNDNATGSATPALGTNSPATVTTAPYTWIKVKAADGTVVFLPAWR